MSTLPEALEFACEEDDDAAGRKEEHGSSKEEDKCVVHVTTLVLR